MQNAIRFQSEEDAFLVRMRQQGKRDTYGCQKTAGTYLSGYDVMRGIFANPWPKDYDAFTAEFKTQTEEIQETADHSFWDSCSQALPSLAEGETYIMMPAASDKSTGLD